MIDYRLVWGTLGTALLAAACAPDVSSNPDAAVRPDALMPVGDHHRFALDSITLPTDDAEADVLGLDLDGDGIVDNKLGGIVSLLAAGGADINAIVTGQVDRGELIHLANLQASDLADATASALYVWKGANPSPPACLDDLDTTCRRHLDGTGVFDVTTEMPGDALIVGAVTAGHFSGGSGIIVLEVPLLISETPLVLKLIGARAEVDVAATGLTGGKLAGAVPDAYVQSDVLPQLHALLGVVVAEDCFGTAPSCCVVDSDGDQAVGLFDSDDSCTISLAELQDNALLDALLAPNVDLLDEEGLSGSDGELDSVSLGIGFSAVPAVYPVPPGL